MCVKLAAVRRAIWSCLCGYARDVRADSNPWTPLFFQRSSISYRILQGNAELVHDEEGFDDVEFSWRRLSETCRSGRFLQHRLLRATLLNSEHLRMESLQHERLTDSLDAMQEVLSNGGATVNITSLNNECYVGFAFQSRREAVLFLQRFRRCNVVYSGISPV